MTRRERAEALRLLQKLRAEPQMRLIRTAEDGYATETAGGVGKTRFSAALVGSLLSGGLLYEAEPGRLAASSVADAWLRRESRPDMPFRAQHDAIGTIRLQDGTGVTGNLDESPVAGLARRSSRSGEPWLGAHQVAAAERLRRDFELGQLQPRITANWSASIATGRRADGGGMADLTDTALAARRRFDGAAASVGPELWGILVDICCFLKGLELVEGERRWPARSAKLVLRLALDRLAAHYGLNDTATGAETRRARHWGAEDYRPTIG